MCHPVLSYAFCLLNKFAMIFDFHLPISRIELVPVGHHARLAVVEEGAQVDAVVPVVGEVPDLAVGQHRLKKRMGSLVAIRIMIDSNSSLSSEFVAG